MSKALVELLRVGEERVKLERTVSQGEFSLTCSGRR